MVWSKRKVFAKSGVNLLSDPLIHDVSVHVMTENCTHTQHLTHTLQILSAFFTLNIKVENKQLFVHKQSLLPFS